MGHTAKSTPPPRAIGARRAAGPRKTIAAVAIATCLSCAAPGGVAVGASGPAAPGLRDARALTASVRFGGRGREIPRAFFGLSMEYNELPTYERSGPLFARVLSLIRPRGVGPMTLRVGGKSADHALWEPRPASRPVASTSNWAHGVYKFDQSWLADLKEMVYREDLRVILDLNLAVHSPSMEAGFSKAVRSALPPGALAGVEIGNEPDMYHLQPPLARVRASSTSKNTPLNWWRNYSAADYRRDYRVYARPLRAAVPGLTLGAPDITYPRPQWMSALTGLGRLSPGFLAVHMYGSSICWPQSSPLYPTIARLLQGSDSARLAGTVKKALFFAHANGMRMRVTEMNSVSCGGNPGVANSFATALWAPDTLFSLIDDGVDGVNFHIRPSTVNSPFHLRHTGLKPEPELYGLALFAQMTHGPAALLNTTLTGAPQLALKAWAVRKGATVNVLLINEGKRAARVSVPAGTRALAHLRRLTAPRVGAGSGVRFAGMWIGDDGRWHGREVQSPVHAINGSYKVQVPPYSAALVTL